MRKPWYANGVQFQCQGSGKCCSSRGEYGFVYLTQNDAKNMAKLLGLKLNEFKKLHCEKTDGALHLKESSESLDCKFLKANRCMVYEARPTQCRTWPFWPENMGAKAWNKAVIEFCPGVNKGPVRSFEEIKTQLNEQVAADENVWGEAFLGP